MFGCGGDRDASKRHKMGKISSEFSDTIILTNDNPQGEVPENKISDIEEEFQELICASSIELKRSRRL